MRISSGESPLLYVGEMDCVTIIHELSAGILEFMQRSSGLSVGVSLSIQSLLKNSMHILPSYRPRKKVFTLKTTLKTPLMTEP
ncbi:hypothetical protein GDO81_013601 [Engystomops pustulosus]|uniref:Uncharacterized protein n=1 Tax=Engystomops pustulosus TaxID=76066 RepID=A0AAV7B0U1_ENGPU|nr:hypothetical protein GDO81_013601 [Engystomops pustulosus]